ncbi:hypothetical protein K502DRAFT_349283 [Neoconidiobolus thromboides FSU 785]|nr:hypothetical protein K502DRAFT_349283 [Neoconidiobolus thromboides FSU 785]
MSNFQRVIKAEPVTQKNLVTKEEADKVMNHVKNTYGYSLKHPPMDRPVRIYCDGIYDLFHFGHAKALQQAKNSFSSVHLIVGVCNDKDTHSRKGRTVMKDTERYESLLHCRWIDEIITDAPWIVDQEFLDTHEIDYVAHDDIPYKSIDSEDVYAFVKAQGRFLPTQRTDGISTSDLITRVVKDYNKYLRRNLERGVTRKELGISYFKAQELMMQKQVEELRSQFTNLVLIWEERSQEIIRGFAHRFGAEDIVDKFLKFVSPRPSTNVSSDSESDESINEFHDAIN